MLDAILSFSLRQRWLVMGAVLCVAAFGAWNFTRLPIDAVPDITNVQVQINISAGGYSPLEVEQRITFPVETAMGGLPKLEYTRSLSRYGLSQVTVVFRDGTDIYFARQLVNERIQQVKDQMPPGVETAMGPVSTGLGEIFMFAVEAKPDARNAGGQPYSRRPSFAPYRTGSSSRSSDGAGHRRGQHDRRLRAPVPCLPDPARCSLPAYVPRCHDGAGRQQRQRWSGIYRAQRRAISRPDTGAGRDVSQEIRDIVIGTRNGIPIRIGDVAGLRKARSYGAGRRRSTARRPSLAPRCC